MVVKIDGIRIEFPNRELGREFLAGVLADFPDTVLEVGDRE